MNYEKKMNKVCEFIDEIHKISRDNGVCFEIIGGYSDNCVNLKTSSDIDLFFKNKKDVNKFEDILIYVLDLHKEIKLISRKKFSSGIHWTFLLDDTIFIFDLMWDMRFHNYKLMDSRIFFELQSSGFDASAIAKFVKSKTGFKQAWPGIPPEIYSFRIIRTTPISKAVYLIHKIFESLFAMLSARNGVFVVVVGPDGSGKSTVIERVIEKLCGERVLLPVFRFHWRPQLFSIFGATKAVTNPHAQAPRGRFLSLMKLVYLWLTFNLGYWLRLHRLLHRGCIVMFDRYYHDLLVDPRRYRLQAPHWLMHMVGKAIPEPDLWILLDASPAVLHTRKQEVPLAETARQRGAYQDLVRQFPNHLVVDAAASPEDVSSVVTNTILNYMARQTACKSGLTLHGGH